MITRISSGEERKMRLKLLSDTPQITFCSAYPVCMGEICNIIHQKTKIEKMKKHTILLFSVLMCSVTALLAQENNTQTSNRVIYGNQKITNKTLTLNPFNQVSVNLFCDVQIECGKMALLEITADANIIKHISIEVKNNTLYIETQKGYWIENSKPIIKIGVPFLNALEASGRQTGIGNISISNIDVDAFTLKQVLGTIYLQGETGELLIQSSNDGNYKNQGKLDASKLCAQIVTARMDGSNTATVCATQTLNATLKDDSNLAYTGNPANITRNEKGNGKVTQFGQNAPEVTKSEKAKQNLKPGVTLQYISCTVKNNTAKRRNFVIAGPNGAGKNFSYGFPLMPFATRAKKVPVGTSIYLETAGIRGKKLITISAEDEGKTLNLFD